MYQTSISHKEEILKPSAALEIGSNGDYAAYSEPFTSLKNGPLPCMKQMNVSVCRYPGGSESSYWDYHNEALMMDKDILLQGGADLKQYQWVKTKKMAIEWLTKIIRSNTETFLKTGKLVTNSLVDYALVLKECPNITPIFTLNLATPSVTYINYINEQNLELVPRDFSSSSAWRKLVEIKIDIAIDFLNRAFNLGFPIKYVELDNEIFFDVDYMKEVNNGGEGYALACNLFSERLLKEFPAVKISANMYDEKQEPVTYTDYWNQCNGDLIHKELCISANLHFYHQADQNLTCYEEYEDFISYMVKQAYLDIQSIQQMGSYGFQEVWITEFFPNFLQKNMYTWANVLATSTYFYLYLCSPLVTILLLHSLEHCSDASGTLTNFGELVRLWSAAKGSLSRRRLSFDNNFKIKGVPALRGFSFEGGEQACAIIINLSSKDCELDISALGLRERKHSYHCSEEIHSQKKCEVETEMINGGKILLRKFSTSLVM